MLLKEEGTEVTAALGGSTIEQEAQHQEASGVMTESSELESRVEEGLEKEKPEEPKKVECLCGHGGCREGESTCSGRCPSGWSGPHCDTPDSSRMSQVNRDQAKDYTKDGLYRPQAITEQHAAAQDAQQFKAAKKIADEAPSGHQSSHHHTPPGSEPQSSFGAEEVPTTTPASETSAAVGEDSRHFSITALLVLGLVVGVVYALGQMGVRFSLPFGASAGGQRRYGPLHRDPAADSDGEDDGDDPAARRKMLELSSFGSGAGGAGPQSRRVRGQAMTSIGEEETKEGDSARGTFPMASFSGSARSSAQPQGAGNGHGTGQATTGDGVADQLQRELELFAQGDEEEEGSLLRTDDFAGSGNWADPSQTQDDAEIQEFEQFFDQGQ